MQKRIAGMNLRRDWTQCITGWMDGWIHRVAMDWRLQSASFSIPREGLILILLRDLDE
jgi:hypothetical protein